ncbi:hypothetical protein CALVIDRAFT_539375 [Calocera viscosa TUFC12733]|uniref:BTB domain-containing protein n=1 Tax=Calocera viscosa (strain TUFC12733) TaxID=1330018 RepID=A0A167JWG4_CALVF|nr:hypothetical protein CALVIDRAFT_539375 [Calocera viscosa TUFC12733]
MDPIADDSSMPTPAPNTFIVPPIFQNPEADILIKSSDNVEFRVWKPMLVEGSVVFKDMFAHPQSSEIAAGPVPWPEPAKVIDRLLTFIYPIVKPALDSLDEVFTIIRAADKWQIDVAVSYLKDVLVSKRFSSSSDDAFRIYAFACEMHFLDVQDEVAGTASEWDPFDSALREELSHMMALDVLRLTKLQLYPRTAFDEHFDDESESTAPDTIQPNAVSLVFQAHDADMAIVSSDGIEFRVFKLYISGSSTILRDKILQLPSYLAGSSLPTLSLTLPSAILETLLYYIYPVPKPYSSAMSLEHVMTCARAAAAFDIGVALQAFRQELVMPVRLRSYPLRIYGFARSMGFEEEASRAKSRAILRDPLEHRKRSDFKELTAHDLVVLRDSHSALMNNLEAALGRLHYPLLYECQHDEDPDPSRRATFGATLIPAMCLAMTDTALFSTADLFHLFGEQSCSMCGIHFPDRFNSSQEIMMEVKQVLDEHIMLE